MYSDLQLVYFFGADLASATTSEVVDMRGQNGYFDSPLRLAIVLNSAPVGGTGVQVTIESSDDLTFTDKADSIISETYDVSAITAAGALGFLHVPSMRRYSRAVITPTGTFTSGKISVFISGTGEFGWPEFDAERRNV